MACYSFNSLSLVVVEQFKKMWWWGGCRRSISRAFQDFGSSVVHLGHDYRIAISVSPPQWLCPTLPSQWAMRMSSLKTMSCSSQLKMISLNTWKSSLHHNAHSGTVLSPEGRPCLLSTHLHRQQKQVLKIHLLHPQRNETRKVQQFDEFARRTSRILYHHRETADIDHGITYFCITSDAGGYHVPYVFLKFIQKPFSKE